MSVVNAKETGEAIMRIKLGLAVVAALALSVAMAASAYAAGFLASKAETLLAEHVSTQVFKTDAGPSECSMRILAGTTATTETTAQLMLIDFEKCKTEGILEAQFTPWDMTFLASGAGHLNKLVKINVPATGCETSIPAQTMNSFDYKTSGNDTLVQPLVTGMKYSQNANCEGGAGTFVNGTQSGHFEVMIPNGIVSFMP